MSDIFEFEDKAKVERLIGTLHDPAATPGDVLTVQADKSIAAQPGGGGGSGVQVITVPVSSAQILDLANTPVTLIPGVAGNVTVVTDAAIFYLAGLVPYLDGGGSLVIRTIFGTIDWGELPSGGSFWGMATSRAGVVAMAIAGAGASQSPSLADVDGADVQLIQDTANPTLGDGTLLVTVSYFLAPTAP